MAGTDRVLNDSQTATLAALRSGKYKQTDGQLRKFLEDAIGIQQDEYGYCCLGVTCDVADPEGWDGEAHKLGAQSAGSVGDGLQDQIAFLGPELAAKLQLKEQEQINLADRNDSGSADFLKIADAMEGKWLRDEPILNARGDFR